VKGIVFSVPVARSRRLIFHPGCKRSLCRRQEGVAWKNVTGEERFLIVARDGIFQPVVFAAFEVAQTQAGLRLVTRDVEDLLTIR